MGQSINQNRTETEVICHNRNQTETCKNNRRFGYFFLHMWSKITNNWKVKASYLYSGTESFTVCTESLILLRFTRETVDICHNRNFLKITDFRLTEPKPRLFVITEPNFLEITEK